MRGGYFLLGEHAGFAPTLLGEHAGSPLPMLTFFASLRGGTTKQSHLALSDCFVAAGAAQAVVPPPRNDVSVVVSALREAM